MDMHPHQVGMTRSLTVDLDGPVHYLDYGGQGAPILLVHGLGGSHVNWIAVAPLLARSHSVYAVDLPGFGSSPFSGRSGRLDENSRLLAHFLERVVRAPATLIGNSMGGLLSMMVAATEPQAVRSLVLVGAPHPRAAGARRDRQVALMFATYMVPFLGELLMSQRAARLTPTQLVDETMRLCSARPDELDRDVIAAHVAMATERGQMAWAHPAFLAAARSIVRSLLTPGWQERIAQSVVAPTLVLHGDRDRLSPIAAARAAAARQRWELEVLRDVGHVPQLEQPLRFIEIVERWLERVHPAHHVHAAH
jgi:pimeloyl-ACP methyl ester carboxylesterase